MNKKIVIAGGTGHVGSFVTRYFKSLGYDVIVLSRKPQNDATVRWDGKTLGDWTRHLENADILINLAGRSVNCRYTEANLKEMMDSRVDSTRVCGLAIQKVKTPPKLWLQMSTATIYAHTFGEPNDETSGKIGGGEPGAPKYWNRSIEIALAWERTQREMATPHTRKIALRTAMVMGRESGSVFDLLLKLTRVGLGGNLGSGDQFVSWIHENDFGRALSFLFDRAKFEGPVNLAAPHPLPQREFMRLIRKAAGIPLGLPATKWMLEIGAFFMRTDTELLLKSRRVVPGKLLSAGFKFEFPNWKDAVQELMTKPLPVF